MAEATRQKDSSWPPFRRLGIAKLQGKESGGEEGIRTLETLLTPTPLAGERLRPLGHLSTAVYALGFLRFQALSFSPHKSLLGKTKQEQAIVAGPQTRLPASNLGHGLPPSAPQ